MRLLESLFAQVGLEGRTVLDLGCGSGQVSLLAASMGARVHGIDISPRMLSIARDAADHAGYAGALRFEEGDAATAFLPRSDVVLLVGVVEYYADFSPLVRRAAEAARSALILAHTNRVAYRMLLRKLLFALHGASLYFHPMSDVVAAQGASAWSRLQARLRSWCSSVVAEPARSSQWTWTVVSCRWAAGSLARAGRTPPFFRRHYGSDRPAGLRSRGACWPSSTDWGRGTFFVLGWRASTRTS
jgi:SAM-dependent methyltransferase